MGMAIYQVTFRPIPSDLTACHNNILIKFKNFMQKVSERCKWIGRGTRLEDGKPKKLLDLNMYDKFTNFFNHLTFVTHKYYVTLQIYKADMVLLAMGFLGWQAILNVKSLFIIKILKIFY